MSEEETSLEKKAPDEPDASDELKGLFEKRRDEGKEDEEILREVFESNPNADIKKLAELTGLTGLTIGRIKGQVAIRRKRDSRVSGTSGKHLEEDELSEPDARQLVAQFGREGLNKLKRGFLKKTLALAPGMTGKTAEWILHKWDINPRVQDDPNVFYEMLHNDAGLKPNIAISFAKDVFSLEEQYADILEGAGEKPIFISGSPRVSGSPTGEPILYRRDQYSQSTGPFEVSGRGGRREPDSGGFLSKEEYLRLEREKEDRRRVEQAEEKRQQREDKFREDITNTLSSFKEELEKKQKPSEESSVEEIPLDAEGKPTTPDKAASVKKVYRGSGGLPREDPLDTMIKMEELRQKMTPKEKGEDPEIRDLKTQIRDNEQKRQDAEKASQKQIEDLKDKQAADKEARFKEQMDRMESKMEGNRTEALAAIDRAGSAGINSMEAGVGQAIREGARKAPVELITKSIERILTTAPPINAPETAPPVSQTPPGASSVIAALREKGLVTTVRERVGQRQ